MTDDELLLRLADAEDGYVERKTSFDRVEVRNVIVAFANSAHEHRPGVLFVGVRPDGSIQGVGDPDALARDSVDKLCKDQCYPPIRYTTRSLTFPAGKVLAVIVPLSLDRPHFSGHAFIREGSRTKEASRAALDEMIAARNTRAGALLRLKGQILSIRILGKAIGEPIFESHFDSEYEGRIVECSAQRVVLFLIGSGTTVAEPLEWVIPSEDTKRHRPLLIIQKVS